MAEFKEVAKIAKRMCDKNERMCITNSCPLSYLQNRKDLNCGELMKEYPEEYEHICLDWAKENPEITNKDKMYQIVKEAFGEDVASNTTSLGSCDLIECELNCAYCQYKGFWDKPYVKPKGETE